MENCPFIDDFPMKTSIDKGFSIAMLVYQRVNVFIRIIDSQIGLKCQNALATTVPGYQPESQSFYVNGPLGHRMPRHGM